MEQKQKTPMKKCFIFSKKLDYSYFNTDSTEIYFDDYFYEDVNIIINNPLEVEGELELTGNINLTTGIKALEDVHLNGEVKNSNESVICSQTGDIIINTTNINLNGIVYAPEGCVSINAQNLNMNNVIIIADTIMITCPSLNANHHTSMADFIGTESEVDLEILAFGEYSYDNNFIEIFWSTTIPRGTFDIQISDDGVTYTSIDTVNDVDSFVYDLSENFDKKYIKVVEKTYYGELGESIPFIVSQSKEGISVDLLDSDEDGLPDVYEVSIGTDINNSDSDKDNLSDYDEVFTTHTDPKIYDSVIEGISDSVVDCDDDELTNYFEVKYGTDPLSRDTDDDKLSDYDEIYLYGTDPLVPDSDEDGIEDGAEIKLKLNPNDPETFDVPDSEYSIQQEVKPDSDILSSVNTESSPYDLSIEIKTNRYIEDELTVSESSYANIIENDSMFGKSIEFNISDTCNPENIVIKYLVKDEYVDNTLGMYTDCGEFQGIKRLNIFKFFEDTNMLLPIETKFDVENNLVYAEVDDLGTYCIMDMELWLNNLGVEPPRSEILTYSVVPNNKSSEWTPTYAYSPLDLVFLLQTAGTSRSNFYQEKSILEDFSEYAFNNYSDVRVYIITFDKTSSTILNSASEKTYFDNFNDVKNALNRLTYVVETGYCARDAAFTNLLNNIKLREDADVFIYHIVNGSNTTSTGSDQLAIYNKSLGVYSEIHPSGFSYSSASYGKNVEEAIEKSGGLNLILANDTLSTLIEHLDEKVSPPRPVYECIVATKWKKITLKGELSPNNLIKSDNDSLTDWEEVDSSKLIYKNGHYDLPTFYEASQMANYVYALKAFDRWKDTKYELPIYNDILNRKILPIFSDPTKEDSDEDGIWDDEDMEPLRIYLNELMQKLNQMEKYIDEYLPYYCNKMSLSSKYAPSNSTIAINILRNYGYGSDEYKLLENPKNDLKQWAKWTATDGYYYPEFKDFINNRDSSILKYLKNYKLFDKNGQEIDFLHLFATLGAERHNIIDPNLAGWAGDLQSTIEDLRKAQDSSNYDWQNMENNVYNLITGKMNVTNSKFPMEDLLADVDAKNIHGIYKESSNLSIVLKDYYTYHTNQRFTKFVDSLGGYGELYYLTFTYTRGNNPIKHMTLHYFAEKNGDREVTEEESNALWIGFMNLMRDKLNEESY